jgi:flagellar basal-body rod modification protein FlgD
MTPEKKAPSAEMGKDAFMQLLIEQMTYQDPMEPMDNTEFVGQLAQFSSLEQMQNIASGIELLTLTQNASTNSQMVNMIGKRVVTPGSTFSVDKENENPVSLRYEVSGEDAPSTLIIKDSNGNTVRTIDITEVKTGINEVMFDGKDKDGNQLESGNYTFKLVGGDGQEVSGVTSYSNYLVDAVQFDGSTILLKSQDITIDLGDISEVIKN